MKVQLPSYPYLSKDLAIKCATDAKILSELTKSQIIDCIQAIASTRLSSAERKLLKVTLMQNLVILSNPTA